MIELTFCPHEQIPSASYAENNKFLPLSSAELSGNYTGNYRRYAVYTYNLTDAASFSALTQLEEPIKIREIQNSKVDVFILTGLSNSVSSISVTGSFLEIYNNSTEVVYLTWEDSVTDFATISTRGLPIQSGSYYSIEKEYGKFTIGSEDGDDVRVFSHKK